ncbi:ABC transporter permease subunit, partial [Deinococcus sp. GbtcB9]|uniref:ABC transporter permease subunit n=1 Tax=Deinococcus sp. GbtcB9 TaxID=2824754 RepID=UPI0034CDE1E9
MLASVILGTAVGLFMALPRLYQIPVLKGLVIVFLSYTRGTPILIQMLLVYYGLPEQPKAVHIDISDLPPLVFVI